jgi:hypothetical protein
MPDNHEGSRKPERDARPIEWLRPLVRGQQPIVADRLRSEARFRGGAPVLHLTRHQPLEPRVASERRKVRIDPEPAG